MGMRVWRATTSLLLALAVVAPGAPAVAASRDGVGAVPVSQVADRLPVGARVAVSDGGDVQRQDAVSDIVLGVRRYADRAEWVSAAAALVERTSGTETAAVAATEEDTPEQGGPTGSVVRAVPAGDLDGDGAADVLTLTFDVVSGNVVVQARRGTDASVLWERPDGADGAVAWPLHADADGDGVDDLSIQALRIHSEDSMEECEEFDGEEWCWPTEYHATFTWTLGVASGMDGSTLWTRDFDGTVDESYSDSYRDGVVVREYGSRYELASTNLYVVGLPAGDLARRGHNDLVVDALDINVVKAYDGVNAGPAWVGDGSLRVRAATRADVVDAATGEVRKAFTDTAEGRISFLAPAPDSVGGPGPDLLWDRTVVPDQDYHCVDAYAVVEWVSVCPDEPEGGWAVDLEMVDGVTLEPAWSASVPNGWFAFPLDDDLDEDGRGDVMAFSVSEDGHVTTALSGVDGATLWAQAGEDWLFPMIVAPLDDVAGQDLVTASFVWGSFGEEDAIVVDRRSGATGDVLSSTRHPLPAPHDDANMTWTMAYAAGAPDGDGDGVGDLTVGWVQESSRFNEETWEEEVLGLESNAVAESGRSGETRRTLAVSGQAAFLFPVADLDGDNLSDVLDERYAYDDDTDLEAVRWTASPFMAGADLWTTSATAEFAWLRDAGDQDGQPGEELLLHEFFTKDEAVWSSVTSISGRTGLERWKLSTR